MLMKQCASIGGNGGLPLTQFLHLGLGGLPLSQFLHLS